MSNELDKLHDKLTLAIHDKLETKLAESEGISEIEARKKISDASFSEWMEMQEATVDRNPGLTSGTTLSPSTPTTSSGMNTPIMPIAANPDRIGHGEIGNIQLDDPSAQLDPSTLKIGDQIQFTNDRGEDEAGKVMQMANGEFELQTDAGEIRKIALEQVKSKTDDNPKSGDKSTVRSNKPSKFKKAVAHVKSNFEKGKALAQREAEETNDLNRIMELAGINETSTAGATSAASIASSPSIIGNTNDGHKPTVQLRKKERLAKVERDRKRDRKKASAKKASHE